MQSRLVLMDIGAESLYHLNFLQRHKPMKQSILVFEYVHQQNSNSEHTPRWGADHSFKIYLVNDNYILTQL